MPFLVRSSTCRQSRLVVLGRYVRLDKSRVSTLWHDAEVTQWKFVSYADCGAVIPPLRHKLRGYYVCFIISVVKNN